MWNQRLEDGWRMLDDDYGTDDLDGLTIWEHKEEQKEEQGEDEWPTI